MCMYVCMHYMYVCTICMYVCMHYMYVCMYYMYVCMYVYVSILDSVNYSCSGVFCLHTFPVIIFSHSLILQTQVLLLAGLNPQVSSPWVSYNLFWLCFSLVIYILDSSVELLLASSYFVHSLLNTNLPVHLVYTL